MKGEPGIALRAPVAGVIANPAKVVDVMLLAKRKCPAASIAIDDGFGPAANGDPVMLVRTPEVTL